jgi:hypothetical protein
MIYFELLTKPDEMRCSMRLFTDRNPKAEDVNFLQSYDWPWFVEPRTADERTVAVMTFHSKDHANSARIDFYKAYYKACPSAYMHGENEQILEKLVEREIYCNLTTITEYILSKAGQGEDPDAPFSWEDVENQYSPGEVKPGQYRLQVQEERGEVAAWLHTFNDEGEEVEIWHAPIHASDDPDGITQEIEVYNGGNWGDPDSILEFYRDTVNPKAAPLECWYDDEDDEPQREEGQYQEVASWWACTEYWQEKMKAQGEVVIDNRPHIWGRTTGGQSISADGQVIHIARDMGILYGLKNSWHETK